MAEPVFALQGVSYQYKAGVPALDAIS